MALDSTDKRLVKGLIWLTVLGALAYVFPGFWLLPGGYKTQKEEEEQAREKLRNEAKVYRENYPQIHQVCFGELEYEPIPDFAGTPMLRLKEEFAKTNAVAQQLIDDKEKAGRMSFPQWTKVPETDQRNPGVWFIEKWEQKRNALATELIAAGVECDDPDIGFRRFSGRIREWDENKTEEYLRELFIAEKIIQLCIRAKQKQEEFEKGNNFQLDAFMRIMCVTPSDSIPTGPSALLANPQYDATEKNPTSPKFRKYRVKYGKRFIQEYPVEILLECDVNSFMRFLHSVRKEGQFLVIRTLEIVSPFLKDSRYDRSELNPAGLPKDPNDPDKVLELKPDHILVQMSAAGMDFFDPDVFKNGLYVRASTEVKTGTGRGRRAIQLPTPNP